MYRRLSVDVPRGAIWKYPPRFLSNKRPKTGLESKRLKQSQSIDPSRATSAHDLQSLINP
jgi:hypothetical protein